MRCNNKIDSGVRSVHCGLPDGHAGQCVDDYPLIPEMTLLHSMRHLVGMHGWGLLRDWEALVVIRNAMMEVIKGERVQSNNPSNRSQTYWQNP